MAMKKAYFFSLDSFLGLLIFTLGMFLMFQLSISAPELDQPYFYATDIVNIFSSTKVSDLSLTGDYGILSSLLNGKEDYYINDIIAEYYSNPALYPGDQFNIILDTFLTQLISKKYKISIYVGNTLVYGSDPADASFLTTKASLINVNNEFKKYEVKVWL